MKKRLWLFFILLTSMLICFPVAHAFAPLLVVEPFAFFNIFPWSSENFSSPFLPVIIFLSVGQLLLIYQMIYIKAASYWIWISMGSLVVGVCFAYFAIYAIQDDASPLLTFITSIPCIALFVIYLIYNRRITN